MASGACPDATAKALMASTLRRIPAALAPVTNTSSACCPAKRWPRCEPPAWNSTGVRCGLNSPRCRAGYRVPAPAVADGAHARRLGVDAALTIAQHGVVVPRAFPQLVDHVEEFVRALIALVVQQLRFKPEVARCAVELRSDDVPADAPVAQVVERGELAREQVRVLVGRGDRHANAQMLRDRGHGRHQQQRVGQRRLRSRAQRCVGTAAVRVELAERVGDEEAVEAAFFQRAPQAGPGSRPL
jgi:hypothetical protein